MPKILLIGGPNGAGKTTTARKLLPEVLDCLEFVNADEIAAGISPFRPEDVAMKAGRIMLERMDELIEQRADFVFESTLATRSFARLLSECRANDYEVQLLFLWLESPALALRRVASRVARGGHNIPGEVVERRYFREIQNLFHLYMPAVDAWSIFNNSYEAPQLVARSGDENDTIVIDEPTWRRLEELAR